MEVWWFLFFEKNAIFFSFIVCVQHVIKSSSHSVFVWLIDSLLAIVKLHYRVNVENIVRLCWCSVFWCSFSPIFEQNWLFFSFPSWRLVFCFCKLFSGNLSSLISFVTDFYLIIVVRHLHIVWLSQQWRKFYIFQHFLLLFGLSK